MIARHKIGGIERLALRPSRRTEHRGASMCADRLHRLLCAPSWIKPIIAFTITTARMTPVSIEVPEGRL